MLMNPDQQPNRVSSVTMKWNDFLVQQAVDFSQSRSVNKLWEVMTSSVTLPVCCNTVKCNTVQQATGTLPHLVSMGWFNNGLETQQHKFWISWFKPSKNWKKISRFEHTFLPLTRNATFFFSRGTYFVNFNFHLTRLISLLVMGQKTGLRRRTSQTPFASKLSTVEFVSDQSFVNKPKRRNMRSLTGNLWNVWRPPSDQRFPRNLVFFEAMRRRRPKL